MITLERVSKRFTRADGGVFTALAPTSLQIAAGEIFGLIGPSGAGKSTLLRLINLLERPDAGQVVVEGVVHQAEHVQATNGADRLHRRARSTGDLEGRLGGEFADAEDLHAVTRTGADTSRDQRLDAHVEPPGNGPQGVAGFDGVTLGCVGSQLSERNASRLGGRSGTGCRGGHDQVLRVGGACRPTRRSGGNQSADGNCLYPSSIPAVRP